MAKVDKSEKIKQVLTRNVQDVTVAAHLKAALESGKKLRVKLGIDPTGSKIHIGRAIVLWKLREYQELGHKIVLIIGDFTALVGDPSDKTGKRPMLDRKQVKENLKNYLAQIGKIIDVEKAEIRYNSEWLGKLDFNEISELADNFSIQQMIERRNFKERWDKHEEISLREFMYPLMQGYDSVAVKSDVELGGTDQLFNLMAGRKLQERYGQKAQDIMTTGMLVGLDGRKMSTSWGNVINIVDSPDEQFGKLMSMRDDCIRDYFYFATRLSREEIESHLSRLSKGENPRDVKLVLAKAVVGLYHGEKAAEAAEKKWLNIFSKGTIGAEDVIDIILPKRIEAVEAIILSGVVKSKSEARRLVEQGGLSLGNKKIISPKDVLEIKDGDIFKVGKKNYFKIRIK